MVKPKLEVVAPTMQADTTLPKHEYFRLVRDSQNMFSVESVIVQDNKIIDTMNSEATFLPIAFDKLRRKTGEAFFKAVQENL